MTGSQRSVQSPKSRLSRNSSVAVSLASVRSQTVASPMPQFLKERLKVIFVYPLEKKYECPSCDEVLRYPVLFEECGHRVCSHCFETEIKRYIFLIKELVSVIVDKCTVRGSLMPGMLFDVSRV